MQYTMPPAEKEDHSGRGCLAIFAEIPYDRRCESRGNLLREGDPGSAAGKPCGGRWAGPRLRRPLRKQMKDYAR